MFLVQAAMKKVTARTGGGKQKWVPKGDEKSADVAAEDDAPGEAPEASTRSEGPYYDRVEMLQFFQVLKSREPVNTEKKTGSNNFDRTPEG